jgi:hypothetical protein
MVASKATIGNNRNKCRMAGILAGLNIFAWRFEITATDKF